MDPLDQIESSKGEPPPVASLQDLTIIESWDPEANKPKYVTFYLVTPDEVVYFGQLNKNKRELSLDEFRAALERVEDNEIYPEIPADIALTIIMKGSDYVPQALLAETSIMEQVAKAQHPNIARYYGCRVRRGRITSIVLERLDQTLTQFAATPDFEQLDRASFINALESAVNYVHSLGLAHNDINPDNIMIKDGKPVLIDFGSCQPVGKRLQSLGTPGWYEELFHTSEKKHDTYSLTKLRDWLKRPE